MWHHSLAVRSQYIITTSSRLVIRNLCTVPLTTSPPNPSPNDRAWSLASTTDLGVGTGLTMTLGHADAIPANVGALVIPVHAVSPVFPKLQANVLGGTPLADLITPLALQAFKKRTSSSTLLFADNTHLVLTPYDKTIDIRTAVHRGLESVRSLDVKNAAISLPHSADANTLDELVRTSVLSFHRFDRHLKEGSPGIEHLTVVDLYNTLAIDESCQLGFNNSIALAEGTVFARELANERAAVVTPSYVEKISSQLAETFDNVRVRIVDSDELRKLGYELILAVGQAARDAARIVVLEVGDKDSDEAPIALVGKGVTFDTGGLNLKPTGSIESMHMDMSGAAAVLGAVRSLAQTGQKRPVVAVLALAENAIGSSAMKPHAILKSVKGSVEVSNTDAEGRLCLADALTFVQQQYKPSQIIDIATLTGACVVALGEYAAGVFSNTTTLASKLISTGENVFERCWRLPVLREHSNELKGEQSDLKSCGKGRYGGASTAAAFLQEFIDNDTPWAHIDIAGPAMYSSRREYMPKDGTGFGAQLLAEYVRDQQ